MKPTDYDITCSGINDGADHTCCWHSFGEAEGGNGFLLTVEGPDGHYSEDDANACRAELTRIVRAVNAHDDLVEALELARATLDYTTADLGDDITTANAKVKIDDALAKAKGDTPDES